MNGTVERAAITTTVSALSDRRLLERTKELSGIEHHLEVVVIDHLLEIEKRRLYLRIGFSGLFDYAVRELGYSEAAAWRRIKAMRLCADIDSVRGRLQDGSMTLNAAAQLQNAFDRQERARTRASRSSTAGASSSTPSGSSTPGDGSANALIPPAPPTGPPRPPAPMLDRSARQALVEQAAGKSTRQVQALLAEVDPELAQPADRVRPLGNGRWEVKTVVDEECRQGLERLKGLLSHVDPHMTLGQLIGRLVTEGLDRHDPSRPPRRRRTGGQSGGGHTSAPKAPANPESPSAPKDKTAAGGAVASASSTQPADEGASLPKSAPVPVAPSAGTGPSAGVVTSAPKSERTPQERSPSAAKRPASAATAPAKAGVRAGRAIPAAAKRQVWERDQGRCSYVDRASGRRCASRHLLEIDHVVPYARGGSAEPNNLRLLCAAHHRHRHERGNPDDLGKIMVAAFDRVDYC